MRENYIFLLLLVKISKYAWGPHTRKSSARKSTSKHGLDVLTHFFDKKDIFAPFLTQKIFFLTRTGTGTGPERGGASSQGTRPRITPGWTLHESKEGENRAPRKREETSKRRQKKQERNNRHAVRPTTARALRCTVRTQETATQQLVSAAAHTMK